MSISELWPVLIALAVVTTVAFFSSSFGIVAGLYNVFDRDRKECKTRIDELEQQVAFLMRLYGQNTYEKTDPRINISLRAGDDSIGSVGGNMERR